MTDAISVSAGRYNTCFSNQSRQGLCFGWNVNGQSGFSTDVDKYPSSAQLVDDLPAEILKTSTSQRHSCALASSGRVFCWGLNKFGQLGNGTPDSGCAVADDDLIGNCPTHPALEANLPSNCNAVDVQVGQNHSCALCSNDQAYCWGSGTDGRLGTGNDSGSAEPLTVALENVKAIATGRSHSCFLQGSSTIICFGNNEHFQLGRSDLENSVEPVEVVLPGAGQ